MKISGVYKITSPSGKCYIGQSINIESRFKQHKDEARRGHKNKFYDAMCKYGVDNFTYEILAEDLHTKIERDSVEVYYISFYNSMNNGYNMTKGGDGARLVGEANGMFGKTHTPEVKQKLSDNRKGTNLGSNNPWHASNRTEDELKERYRKALIAKRYNESLLSDEDKILMKLRRSEDRKALYANMDPIERAIKTETATNKGKHTMSLKSKQEIEDINSKKALKGDKNGRATFYILTNPAGEQYIVSMATGLTHFCINNSLVYSVLYSNRYSNIPIKQPSSRDTLFNKDPEYKYRRINTIGWKIRQYKRIKI